MIRGERLCDVHSGVGSRYNSEKSLSFKKLKSGRIQNEFSRHKQIYKFNIET